VTWQVVSVAAAALLALGAGEALPLPNIVAVTPSGLIVPERLLRISITFATPPQDEVLNTIDLVQQDGGLIEGALLDQELWSPDRRTLTLLLDPGRVKTGLIAHDIAGWALRPDDHIMLQIAGRIEHRWTVIRGGCVVPDIGTWRIDAPRAGTDLPLTVVFPGSIDAQSRDLIAVVNESGHRIEGKSQLSDAERVWVFTPASPWTRGHLSLLVHPRLESPCGDEIGEAFEHVAGQGLGSRRTALSRRFSVD
jgi:hypothetical protein